MNTSSTNITSSRQANVFALANASADAKHYWQDGNGYTYMFPQNPGAAGNNLGSHTDTALPDYSTPDEGMQTIPIHLADFFSSHNNSKSVKLINRFRLISSAFGRIMKNSTVTAIKKCKRQDNSHMYLVTVADSVTGEKVRAHNGARINFLLCCQLSLRDTTVEEKWFSA